MVGRSSEMPQTPRFRRQPVHTVYGGAHLFAPDTTASSAPSRCGRCASTRRTPARSPARSASTPPWPARIYPRIVDKLEREPVEDYRIDFEDGFGSRPDDEEDAVARQPRPTSRPAWPRARCRRASASASRRCTEERSDAAAFAPSISFSRPSSSATGGTLPRSFVVTLPKITAPDQVDALASACDDVRATHQPARGSAHVRADDRDAAVDLPARRPGRAPTARRTRPRAHRRRALRHVRLHGVARHHGGAPAHAAPGLRFRPARHAGVAGGHGRVALGRRDEHHAGRAAQSAAGWRALRAERAANTAAVHERVAPARGSDPSLARQRLLPGLGPASGPAPDALRRGLRLLSSKDSRRRPIG